MVSRRAGARWQGRSSPIARAALPAGSAAVDPGVVHHVNARNDAKLAALAPLTLPRLSARPLVTVLMANYNYAQFIGAAIESVLQQSYENFELIVIDDGSRDGSADVIRRYAQRDSR